VPAASCGGGGGTGKTEFVRLDGEISEGGRKGKGNSGERGGGSRRTRIMGEGDSLNGGKERVASF